MCNKCVRIVIGNFVNVPIARALPHTHTGKINKLDQNIILAFEDFAIEYTAKHCFFTCLLNLCVCERGSHLNNIIFSSMHLLTFPNVRKQVIKYNNKFYRENHIVWSVVRPENIVCNLEIMLENLWTKLVHSTKISHCFHNITL